MGFFSKLGWVKTPEPKARDNAPSQKERRYTSVEVISEGACCAAAQALAGQRFLSEDAPRLPLRDCDQPECACKYLHYTDRRTDIRRDTDAGVGFGTMVYHGDCRRTKARGRRKTDYDPDF